MLHALPFLVSGVVVVGASIALSRYADDIAVATGLGRLWIGAVLLAIATSLPEVTTDVVAVRLGAADLAVGDLFGSSMANMLILALVDLLLPRQRMLRRASLDSALVACLAIALNALAALLVLSGAGGAVGGVGIGSTALLLGYGLGLHVVLRQSRQQPVAAGEPGLDVERPAAPLRRAAGRFLAAALLVLLAAPAFAWSAKGVAEASGLGHTFVGVWLVGFSTSLPELVTCLAAVRRGAFDLAVGNLFGSNAFNMAIFFFLDLASAGIPVTALVEPAQAIAALLAIVLMAIGLGTIAYRVERRAAVVEPGSALMVATYAAGLWALYLGTR